VELDVPAAIPLLGLAVALGLDSFRATIGLGALRPSASAALRVAASFAVIEAVTPLIGAGAGSALAGLVGGWTSAAGPLALAAAGIYMLISARRGEERDPQAGFGLGTSLVLPLTLSLDNLLAGGGIGLLGISPLPTAALIGVTSGVLALAGLACGALLSSKAPMPTEMLSGLILLGAAGVAALEH
jgi:putative Mn2+ efflux pump MntP